MSSEPGGERKVGDLLVGSGHINHQLLISPITTYFLIRIIRLECNHLPTYYNDRKITGANNKSFMSFREDVWSHILIFII